MNKPLLALLLLALSLSGCSRPDPLVGTWTTMIGTSTTTQTFNADKTFTAQAKAQGMTFVEHGTWTSTDKEIVLTRTGIDITGGDPTVVAAIKQLAEKKRNEVVRVTYRFPIPEELEFAVPNGAKQVFTRKK